MDEKLTMRTLAALLVLSVTLCDGQMLKGIVGGKPPSSTPFIVGYDTIGTAGEDYAPDYIVAAQFTAPASGNATNINIYCADIGGGGHATALAVYADSSGTPGARLSNSVTVTCDTASNAWKSTSITWNGISNGTLYWLAFNNQAGNVTLVKYDTGGANTQYYVANAYTGTMPDPMPGSGGFSNHKFSIYVNAQ